MASFIMSQLLLFNLTLLFFLSILYHIQSLSLSFPICETNLEKYFSLDSGVEKTLIKYLLSA